MSRAKKFAKSATDSIRQMRSKGDVFAANGAVVRGYDPPVTIAHKVNYKNISEWLREFADGMFHQTSMLTELAYQDGKIQSCLKQRTNTLANLYSRNLEITPADDSEIAGVICDHFRARVYDIIEPSNLKDCIRDNAMLGVHFGQIVEREDEPDLLGVERWHPANCYYQLSERRFKSITSNLGVDTMVPHGNQWIVISGESDLYRCWMHGAISYLAPFWAYKQFSFRDWQSFIRAWSKALKVLVSRTDLDKDQKADLEAQLEAVDEGRSTLFLPDGATMTVVSAPAANGDVAADFLAACDKQIAVTLLGMDVDADGGAYNAVGTVYEGVVLGFVRDDVVTANKYLKAVARAVTQRKFGARSLAPTIKINADGIQYSMQSGGQQPASPSRDNESAKKRTDRANSEVAQ